MITTPNVDFVPEPHIFEEEDICARADGRFGLVDCFQWPQVYHKDYEFALCIPRQDTVPTLGIVWYNLTRDDFIIPDGSQFVVGMLQDSIITKFEELCQLLYSRYRNLRTERTAARIVLDGRMGTARHEVKRLRHHPLVFRDLVIFVAQLQRTLLDVHALLDYIEILRPLLVISPPSKPLRVNRTWMGCFTTNTEVCEGLYYAGVPVWFVRSDLLIPPTMNIVRPVRLTFPEGIVRAMYSENGVAKPFPTIYRGPAGPLRHQHTRRYYQGSFTQRPEPLATGSSTAHVSSQQPSRGGKQVNEKRCKGPRVKTAAGPSEGL